MKFSQFVTSRMEPFLAMRAPYGTTVESMFKPLRDLLIELAGVNKTIEMLSELHWIQSPEGGRVDAVLKELQVYEEVPTLIEVRRVWTQLYPPMNLQREECRRCKGSGFIIIEGPFGTSAAYPCSHKEETAADRRLGVRFTPAVAKLYHDQTVAADLIRGTTWRYDRANPMREKMPPPKPHVSEESIREAYLVLDARAELVIRPLEEDEPPDDRAAIDP